MNFLGPLHVLFYSSLLGTELYQSFVVTKIAHKTLPRSAFTSLQKRIFPVYFFGQTALLFLTMVTIPPAGPLSLVADKTAWIPFSIAGMASVLNLLMFGPKTRRIMIERIHQGSSCSRPGTPDHTGNSRLTTSS